MKMKVWVLLLVTICVGGFGAWGAGTLLRKASEGHGFQCEWGENVSITGSLKSAATCTNKAVYYYTCAKCNAMDETRTFEYGEALGHNYENGVCTRCGGEEVTE